MNNRRHCTPPVGGFTLAELLLILALAAVLITLGIPGLQQLLQANRMAAAANALRTHLQYARSYAILHQRPTVLCPSGDGRNCGAGHEWHHGWLVFTDVNGNRRYDAADRVLRSHSALARVRIDSSIHRTRIRFGPQGWAGFSNTTFALCDPQGRHPPRALVLHVTGRTRLKTTGVACSSPG